MDGSEALLALAGMTRLNGWIDRAVLEAQFDGAARLAGSVPLLIAHMPIVDEFTMIDAQKFSDRLLEALPA
jgi:hypothetical protein